MNTPTLFLPADTTEPEILAAMEENLYAYIAALSHAKNNMYMDTPQLLMTGNGIVGRLHLPYSDYKVSNLIQHIISQPKFWLWWFGPQARPLHLPDLLDSAGCRPDSQETGLYLRLGTAVLPAPAQLRLETVQTPAQFAKFADILMEHWEVPSSIRRAEYLADQKFMLHPSYPVKFLLAYSGNQPAGICELMPAAGAAGLYAVTVPRHLRGQGLGRQLICAASRYAASLGFQILVLQSAAATLDWYVRQGFQPSGTFYKYRSD